MQEKIIYDVPVRLKSESRTMKFLGFILKPFNPKFMSHYWTTWFGKVYAPNSFNINDESQFLAYKTVLEHENIHLKDMRKWHIWFIFSYLFCLPILLAYGRWYWERKAYLPELIKIRTALSFPKRFNSIVNSLGGPSYLWAWPKKWIRKWFLKKIYGDKGHPFDELSDGSLKLKEKSEVNKSFTGRGLMTNGKIGMRQSPGI